MNKEKRNLEIGEEVAGLLEMLQLEMNEGNPSEGIDEYQISVKAKMRDGKEFTVTDLKQNS